MHLKNSQLSTNASPDSGVTLTVFKSQRRLIVNGTPSEQAKWLHHCSLDFGTRDDSDGILVPVCYYDGNDISSMIIQSGGGVVNIAKPQRDLLNEGGDYTFSICIQVGADRKQFFRGELVEEEGEWDWEGSFARGRKQSFDEPSKEIEGPDGHSLQELLLYPSLSLQGTNPARQEAAHILTRIIQASIPGDVQATLRIKIPPLDEEEEKIRLLGEDFFPRAAVVTLFKHWRDSDHVHKKQRDRMNPIRCEKFFEACASSSIPSGQVDPVVEFGWGRKRDANVIKKKFKSNIAWLALHATGSATVAKSRADYLTSPNYCERFKLRVLAQDPRVAPDILERHTQLSILKEAAGEQIAAEQKIDDIINHLKELVVLSSINRVQLDDSLIASLNESFDEIEKISVDSEEYIELNKLLGLKQTLARSGTRRAVIQTLQHYQSSCHRILTIGEVIKALYLDISSAKCLGIPMHIMGPMIIGAAMITFLESLVVDRKQLSTLEKMAIYLSLAPFGTSFLTSAWDSAKSLRGYITNFLPSRMGKVVMQSTNYMESAVRSGLSKIGFPVNFGLAAAVGGLCVWNAFNRFQKMRKDGESIDIWGAGGDFMLSILFFAVTICKIIVLAYGTSSVLYWYGVLSGGIVAGALMTSVAVAVIKWYWDMDPTAPFITK